MLRNAAISPGSSLASTLALNVSRIKDLDKFGRALRLRWLWHRWDQCDRPWKALLKQQDQSDRDLFFASTYVIIGNGKDTPFWEANWLNGAAPIRLAPNLYKQARFKRRTVHQELTDHRWITNLRQLDTQTLLDEFALLYTALSGVELSNEKDQILWRWTSSGRYTASSAYNIQFQGAITTLPATHVWKAKTEPKCRFFGWLAIHGKVQTADNLMKKNYPCNPICPLCYCIPETTEHLLTECNYTEATWGELVSIFRLPTHVRQTVTKGVTRTIANVTALGNKTQKKELMGTLLSFWWQIWKERNRRIFDQKESSFKQVAHLANEAIKAIDLAHAPTTINVEL